MSYHANSRNSKATSLEIDLLMIGRSRNGKSSTGNSIIGTEAFMRNTQSSLVMKPQQLTKQSRLHGEFTINVVDGLNIGEFTSSYESDVERDINSLTDAMKMCNNGFSALLIVVKFGVQFSDEEVEALQLLKSILGDHILQDYGICVITYKDNYQHALDVGEFRNFEEWCHGQPSGFRKIIGECKNRCALFNNRADSPKERNDQFEKLFAILKKLCVSGKRYSEKDFQVASSRHRQLLKKMKPKELVLKTSIYLQDVEERLNELKNSKATSTKNLELENLEKEVIERQQILASSSNKSKEVDDCDTQMSVLLTEIQSQIKKIKMDNMLQDDHKSLPRESLSNDLQGARRIQEQSVWDQHNPPETEKRFQHIQTHIEQIISKCCEATASYSSEMTSLKETLSHYKREVQQNPRYRVLLSDIQLAEQTVCQAIQQMADNTSVSVTETQTKKMKAHDAREATRQGASFPLTDPRYPRDSSAVNPTQIPAAYSRRNVSPTQHSKDVHTSAFDSHVDSFSDSTNVVHGHSRQSHVDLKELSLLLIGLSGNGRSSTGNSIVGRSAFKTTSSMSVGLTSSTAKVQKESSMFGNIKINVIDGSGIDDSVTSMQEDLTNTLEKSLDLSGNMFSALLIVIKFGQRFTKQEARAMKIIKHVLGENVIKEFGICVVTHGDNFESEARRAERNREVMTFEGWCREQRGDIKDLFEECNFRVVLFDNKTKSDRKKETQRKKLLDIVDKKRWFSRE